VNTVPPYSRRMTLPSFARARLVASVASVISVTCLLGLATLLAACAVPPPTLDSQQLAAEMQRRPNVLLGEVHDNRAQHAVRAQALRLLLERGARPAMAFEQFDREKQSALDAARTGQLPAGTARVDHLIAQAGARGWDWPLYRPYLELALQYDLPIVAANLSRADATRATRDGVAAVFDAAARDRMALDRLPEALIDAQAEAVNRGHCDLLSPEAARRLARAQIARDAALAEAIRPHLAPAGRGVILFTGNGHARNDIGVPFFLTPEERTRTWTIGIIEDAFVRDAAALATRFDARFVSPTQERPDPCEPLRRNKSRA
jgi:uncharacterized iron-regulated protein